MVTANRIIAMLALAASALILAAPSPADAATSGRLCETNDSYCMGADSLQFNVPVTEKSLSSARYLTAVLQSGTFEGHDKYKLRFNADHSLCVGGSTLESVIVEDCSSTGTVWAKDGTRWINVAETVSFGGGSDVYIAGYDRSGYSYQFKYLGQTGFHYQFAWK